MPWPRCFNALESFEGERDTPKRGQTQTDGFPRDHRERKKCTTERALTRNPDKAVSVFLCYFSLCVWQGWQEGDIKRIVISHAAMDGCLFDSKEKLPTFSFELSL